ncbi:hypothetical protein F5Y01DRAFT_274234, partial [Xylaria sp. FL0043]
MLVRASLDHENCSDGTRPEQGKLDQELVDQGPAETNPVRQEKQLERSIPDLQSTGDADDAENADNTDMDTSDLEGIPNEDRPCEYMQPYNNFEPLASQSRGLGTWVPMFMTEKDLYKIAPTMETLCERQPGSLLTFIRYLSPNYICFRADESLALFAEASGLQIQRDAKAVVQAWNSAYGFTLRSSLTRVFLARGLFRFGFEDAASDQPKGAASEKTRDVLLAALDAADYHGHHYRREKWRKILDLGANLHAWAEKFGGEGFLALFPFFELESILGTQLPELLSSKALWTALSELLQSTEMGMLFKSMAAPIGVPLVRSFWGGPSITRSEFFLRLNHIRRSYSLSPILEFSQLKASILANQPRSVAFGYCGRLELEVKHWDLDLSLTPLSLLQLAGSHLEPQIVEYLIHKQLPRNWKIVGREGLRNAASKDLLLCDYVGIVIPLCIDGGWTLLCYSNPVYLQEDECLLKFVNPTKNSSRCHAALKTIESWIPTDRPWIPNGLRLDLVKEMSSQQATEEDSGIHIIVEAISMARTGKPESRPLNEQICKGLRIKYFVELLNEVQEVVNKEIQNKSIYNRRYNDYLGRN